MLSRSKGRVTPAYIIITLLLSLAVILLLYHFNSITKDAIYDQHFAWSMEFKTGKKLKLPTNLPEVYLDRQKLLHETCVSRTNTDYSLSSILQEQVIFIPRQKVAYCPNAKTGTSFWMSSFLNMAKGFIPDDVRKRWIAEEALAKRIKSLYRYPPLPLEDQLSVFKGLFSFTFVRHPFVRLVSTYQDKVVDHNYLKWREKIWTALNKKGRTKEEIPSFRDFVQFHLDGGTKNDVHVMPFIKKCGMCDLKYSVIGKLETAEADMMYILSQMGLYDREELFHKRSHMSSGGNTEQLALKYFKTISKQQFDELELLYLDDFIAFDYDASTYDVGSGFRN